VTDKQPGDPGSDRPDLAAEIATMVAAVQDWARRAMPDSAIGHASECQWCPLCQFVNVLRGEHPEVGERIAEAGTALAGAMKALADAAASRASGAPREGRDRPRPTPRVQHIDLHED
jgi:hypothetical protein